MSGGGGEAGTAHPRRNSTQVYLTAPREWLKPGLKRPVCRKRVSFSTHIKLYKERRRASRMAKETSRKPHFQEK